MINKKIISIFTICILSIVVLNINITKSNAQSESVLFEETIIKKIGLDGEDYCSKIIKDGNDYIVLINFSSTEINGHMNNGVLNSLIVKLDSNLNVLKDISLGGESCDSLNDIIKIKDGYIAVGYSSSKSITKDNLSIEDGWIVQLDKELNVVKQLTVSGANTDMLVSIKEVDDGYIVIGETNSYIINGNVTNGLYDISLFKFDYNLNIIKEINLGGEKNEFFSYWPSTNNNVLSTKDGLIFTFTTKSSNVLDLTTNNTPDKPDKIDTVIVEIDKDLNILNKKIFGGNDDDILFTMINVNNGYAFIGGTTSTNINYIENLNDYTYFVIELDYNFNLTKAKTFLFQGELMINELVNTKNGYRAFGFGMDEFNVGLTILDFDKDFNLINTNFYKDEMSVFVSNVSTGNEYVCSGMSYGDFKAIIKKVRYLYKNTQSVNLEIVADNSLEMSISTNKISFEGYNGVEDLNNNNLNLTVSSGLYYDLYATLDTEIRGTNDTNAIIDKANLKIKTSDDLEYKSFTNIGEKVNIVANHKNGRDFIHNINLKLLKDSSVKADTYNTNITFEVVQK